MEPQDVAELLVKYYDRLVAESKHPEDWTFAADTAKWWLRLVNQETPDLNEVNNLMDVLNSHELGTGWQEMRIFARAWQSRLLKK
jgi:hypothetical protein